MSDVAELWDRVRRRSAEPQHPLIEGLRQFLAAQDNPHACQLSGITTDKPLDQDSAEQLETLVIAHYRNGKLSKLDCADWLRLIYVALKELQRHQVPVIHLTRLALAPAPEPSPFSPAAMQHAERFGHWHAALQQWILTASTTTSRKEWQAAILLSSILHGALLDQAKLKLLLERITQGKPLSVANTFVYMDFNMPFQGPGNHHLQRWFPDPLTEMLIWRMPADGVDLPATRLRGAINALLVAQGMDRAWRVAGIGDLMAVAATWWSERSARIDVQCIRREIAAHSIHSRSWDRFHGLPASATLSATQQVRDGVSDQESVWSDLPILFPWLMTATEWLGRDDVNLRQGIKTLTKEYETNPLAKVYLGWADFMLDGNSATRKALKPSTIRRWFLATVPLLLLHLGEDNPSELPTEVLEDHYAELVDDRDPAAPVKDIANGLREFHFYLTQSYQVTPIRNTKDTLGDDAELKPVDANLITFDDYQMARCWLDDQLLDGADPDDVEICKLVLALGFCLGLRRMEIFGMRLQDIHVGHGLVFVVRPHPERRLKTANSKRLVPAHAFLDAQDRKALKRWLARRTAEEARTKLPPNAVRSPYIFARVDAGIRRVSVEGVGDRVYAAIRAATGDKRLFMHHLRHAFGTWTYLRLRAPDYPQVRAYWSHLPATTRALMAGTRLRRVLLGKVAVPSRIYAYAVARLLGHSGPAVSMGHYIHSSDVLMAAITQRELAAVPRPICVAASGLSPTMAYQHLEQSEHHLAIAVRNATENDVRHLTPPPAATDVVPAKARMGRPPNVPAPPPADWVPLRRVRAVLILFVRRHGEIDAVARQLQMAVEHVESILCAALRWGPLARLPVDDDDLIRCPPKPKNPDDKTLAGEVEERLGRLAATNPALLREGITMHLRHFNRQKQDVVFKGRKEEEALRRYLGFLAALGLDLNQFQVVVRRPAADGAQLPEWVTGMKKLVLPPRVRRVAPPTIIKAASYAQWLGIQPVDSQGSGLGQTLTDTIFLARIATTD